IERVKKEQGISRAVVEKALNALVEDTKLVNLELRNDTYFYEIVSEFLVPWIFQQKQKLAARAARTRLIRRVAFASLLLLVLIGLSAFWYREQNTAIARESQIVHQLESKQHELGQTLEANKKLIEAKSKEAFAQDLLDQKKQAESERDQAKLALSVAGNYVVTANSKITDLEETKKQLESKLSQAQKDFQQADQARQEAETGRKQAEDKVAPLQAQLDKLKNQPQEPIDASKVPQLILVSSAISKSSAHTMFGESASKKYTFVMVTVRNSSEFDVKIISLTVIAGNTRVSVQQGSGYYYGLEIEKIDKSRWRLPAIVPAKTNTTGIIVIPPTDQDPKVAIVYGLEKVLGTYEMPVEGPLRPK
ncbi:MAG TPA: hypothetical protein VGJ30_09270, partial [Candidatus Angelobacter sp.]